MSTQFREVQIPEFSINFGQNSRTVKRTFIKEVNDEETGHCGEGGLLATTLPKLGDRLTKDGIHDFFPDGTTWGDFLYEFAELQVTDIDASLIDETTDKQQYIVTYSNEPGIYAFEKVDETTKMVPDVNETLRIGGEWLTIESIGDKSGTKWIYTPNPVNSLIKRWVTTATYSVSTYGYSSINEANQFKNGNNTYYFSKILNKILGAAYVDSEIGDNGEIIGPVCYKFDIAGSTPPPGTPIDGNWMCNGIDIDEYWSPRGIKRFKRTETYTYKKISHEDIVFFKNVDPYDTYTRTYECAGWNLVFKKEIGKWSYTTPLTFQCSDNIWPRNMPFYGST